MPEDFNIRWAEKVLASDDEYAFSLARRLYASAGQMAPMGLALPWIKRQLERGNLRVVTEAYAAMGRAPSPVLFLAVSNCR